jgi:hypothetical protein
VPGGKSATDEVPDLGDEVVVGWAFGVQVAGDVVADVMVVAGAVSPELRLRTADAEGTSGQALGLARSSLVVRAADRLGRR